MGLVRGRPVAVSRSCASVSPPAADWARRIKNVSSLAADRTRSLDRDTFVDTSSYGPRGLDALIRVLGIDVIVSGSDRPYADPTDPDAGAAARHAIGVVNPNRLLAGMQ